MPLSDYDHVTALRNKILNAIKQKENEIRDLQDLARALGEAPKLLAGESIESSQGSPDSLGGHKQINRNLTQHMREYVSSLPLGATIKVSDVVDHLVILRGSLAYSGRTCYHVPTCPSCSRSINEHPCNLVSDGLKLCPYHQDTAMRIKRVEWGCSKCASQFSNKRSYDGSRTKRGNAEG